MRNDQLCFFDMEVVYSHACLDLSFGSVTSLCTTKSILSPERYTANMYASTIIIAALVTLASSATIKHTDPLPEGPIKVMLELEKGAGHTHNITGKHHEVIAHIKRLNPWWHRESTYKNATSEQIMNGSLHGYAPHHSWLEANGHSNLTDLEKRSNRFDQKCNWPYWPWAQWGREQTNVAYLTSHYGNAMCGVGPRTCGRFSCSYNAAILLCNDSPNEVVIPCPLLAQNHNFVLQYCSPTGGGNGWHHETALYTGQAFYHNPEYNVVQKGTDRGKEC